MSEFAQHSHDFDASIAASEHANTTKQQEDALARATAALLEMKAQHLENDKARRSGRG